MILKPGEKVHIITRRLFENDLRRHFAGEIERVSDSALRVRGYSFVYDGATNEFLRREEERLRVFPTEDAGLIINVIPDDTDLAKLAYLVNDEGERILTDGKSFSINVSEFGARR
ncbi:MAG: hypothetical protein R3335_14355 [Anaerolineales bacterium]|nr:hypothetical protein [Anaerolineales bacterium]